MIRLLTVAVRHEQDVVSARQRARQLAALLGFEPQDQARIATAASEIVRNAHRYAGGGEVEFSIEGERPPQRFAIQVRDKGRGVAQLDSVLDGSYRSETGMGLGIVGARRLMDEFSIDSTSGGTCVTLRKVFPEAAPLVTPASAGRIVEKLAAQVASSPFEEMQQQNRDLLRTMDELRARQQELLALNQELEDTNRGVVALYAELEERADYLRRADETKSRFLSSVSHELRTPLNSIRALTGLLLERVDGPLNAEQALQLEFVRKAAENLAEMVDGLLDLAKIEAGKAEVRPEEFEAAELFGALRGMLRPLLLSDKVALNFEAAPGLPRLFTDEGKLSQILRNLVSNALKFTERGEIRVEARPAGGGAAVEFSVTDTGIGIPREHQESIFEEFVQVPNALQARVKGTGLGLPLCRRLAALLGGHITVDSEPGRGSTFTVKLPARYAGAHAVPLPVPPLPAAAPPLAGRVRVLLVEDEPDATLVVQKLLRGSRYDLVPARDVNEAREALARFRPAVVLLDLQLALETSWRLLAELKSTPAAPPVVVLSSVDNPRKAISLGADAYLNKPADRVTLLETLERLTRESVLVIDDDPAARYTIGRCFDGLPCRVVEAADAREGLRTARNLLPSLIVLDLKLPDGRGEDVLQQLGAQESTQRIPVVVVTSELLTAELRQRLGRAVAVLSKSDLRREALAPHFPQ